MNQTSIKIRPISIAVKERRRKSKERKWEKETEREKEKEGERKCFKFDFSFKHFELVSISLGSEFSIFQISNLVEGSGFFERANQEIEREKEGNSTLSICECTVIFVLEYTLNSG